MTTSPRRAVQALVAPLAAALLVLVLAACAVQPQARPVAIDVGPATASAQPPPSGSSTVTVYFVRGAHLHEVDRPAPQRSPQAALDQLVAGPTRAEVTTGTRTALVPQPFTAGPDPGGDAATVVVAATSDFASVSGGNQLLAAAQLVWTVTGVPGVQRVRFTVDGTPVEVPTDAGLRGDAVGRSDYASVAPPAEEAAAVGPVLSRRLDGCPGPLSSCTPW